MGGPVDLGQHVQEVPQQPAATRRVTTTLTPEKQLETFKDTLLSAPLTAPRASNPRAHDNYLRFGEKDSYNGGNEYDRSKAYRATLTRPSLDDTAKLIQQFTKTLTEVPDTENVKAAPESSDYNNTTLTPKRATKVRIQTTFEGLKKNFTNYARRFYHSNDEISRTAHQYVQLHDQAKHYYDTKTQSEDLTKTEFTSVNTLEKQVSKIDGGWFGRNFKWFRPKTATGTDIVTNNLAKQIKLREAIKSRLPTTYDNKAEDEQALEKEIAELTALQARITGHQTKLGTSKPAEAAPEETAEEEPLVMTDPPVMQEANTEKTQQFLDSVPENISRLTNKQAADFINQLRGHLESLRENDGTFTNENQPVANAIGEKIVILDEHKYSLSKSKTA